MVGPRRVARDVDSWFAELYEIYLRRWHPAVAAIQAQKDAVDAVRRGQRIVPRDAPG